MCARAELGWKSNHEQSSTAVRPKAEFAKKTNARPKYRRGTSTKRQLISSEQKKCGINQQMGMQFRQACREKPEAQKI